MKLEQGEGREFGSITIKFWPTVSHENLEDVDTLSENINEMAITIERLIESSKVGYMMPFTAWVEQ